MAWNAVGTEPDAQASKWNAVRSEPDALSEPKEGDLAPADGTVPHGFYAVTGDDGRKTLRHDTGFEDTLRSLSDLPGVGMAERIGQGATRLAGKAASGIAGLFGGVDTVHDVQDAVNSATELPPSNDPAVQGVGLVGKGAQAVADATGADKAVGNLPAGPRTAIESTEEAIPDIASVLGFGAGARSATAAAAPTVARTGADVGAEAGYTGVRSRSDLSLPGPQAITDKLISADAGVPEGTAPSVAAVRTARVSGPARVYNQARNDLPHTLQQDPPLQSAISGLTDSTSQLPRSPDVEALQQTMLNQPTMTRDQLFNNISAARQRSSALLASEGQNAVDNHALGEAYGQLADSYEDFVERQLPVSSSVTIDKWRTARTQFAKSHTAEEALKGGEHFDPAVYGRIAARNPDLLTGNAQIVGNVANSLPTGGGGAGAAASTAGAGAGALAGHFAGEPISGAMIGALAAPAVQRAVQRFFTRGDLGAAGRTASNPALSYFFGRDGAPPRAPLTDLTPPPGRAGRDPQQLGLGDLAQGSGPSPFTLGEGANPNAPAPQGGQGGVSLADLLSHGVEQSPPAGLSAGPMGSSQQGLTFRGSPEAVGAKPVQGGSPALRRVTDDFGNQVYVERGNSPGAQTQTQQVEGSRSSPALADRFAPQNGEDTPLGDRFAPRQAPQEPGVQYQGRVGVPVRDSPYFEGDERQLHQTPGVPDDTATRTTPQPKVTHEADEDTGAHVFRTANGETHAQENGPYLMSKRTDTAEAAQGQGENTARLEAQIQEAEHRGLIAGSDVSVTEAAAKGWKALERKGYNVKQNDFTTNTHTKNGKTYKTFVSKDPRKPVFEATTPLAKAVGQ